MKRHKIPNLLLVAALVLAFGSVWPRAQTISNIKPILASGTLSASDTGTCYATNTKCVVALVGGYASVSVQVTGNAGANTLQFEETLDPTPSASSVWVPVTLTTPNQVSAASSTTSTGVWSGGVNASAIRVRMSTLVTGTAVITIRATMGGAPNAAASLQVLHTWTTPVSNVGTTETTLASYTLPADSLGLGQKIRIVVWGTSAANTNQKTITGYFGSKAAFYTSFSNSSYLWSGVADVIATGTATETYTGHALIGPAFGASTGYMTGGSATEDLTSAVLIKITAQSNTASGDVTMLGGWVQKLPAGIVE